MKKLTDLAKDDICALPWMHTEISLQNNFVGPCCKFRKNMLQGSQNKEFKIVWNNASFKKLRSDLLANKKVSECQSCDVREDEFSYKKFKHSNYIKNNMLDIDANNHGLPKVFHFALKNTCNLACRMCSPGASSKLGEVVKKSDRLNRFYLNTYKNDFPIDIQTFKGSFVNAEQISISGGEPLIDTDCITLIEMIKEESVNLKFINFSTNMTKLNKKLLEFLSSFDKSVNIIFSISLDGPKHIHEYIRYGCSWNDIIDNIKYIKLNYPNITFSINSTLSAFNIGYVEETLKEFHDMETQLGITFNNLMVSPVLFPKHLHPSIIPDKVKQTYLEKLQKIDTSNYSIPNSTTLITTAVELLTKPNQETPEQFFEFVTAFDNVAGTDFRQTYPELVSVSKVI
jgi:MoaA/NifB/PqqE/SkfB family radical SAM enzyme